MNLIGFSGSLRKASYNRMLLRAVGEVLPSGHQLTVLEIGGLPLYDQDLEASFPPVATEIKKAIKEADGIVIATPEFNRSMSGALKNMLDWTSRPYGDSAWGGKPVLVMGCSGGAIGTALAQYDLKKVLSYLNCRVLGQPEIYIGVAQEKFSAEGVLTDEKTRTFLAGAVSTFITSIK